MVGEDLALLGEDLAQVGEEPAWVGERLARFTSSFALVGELSTQVGEGRNGCPALLGRGEHVTPSPLEAPQGLGDLTTFPQEERFMRKAFALVLLAVLSMAAGRPAFSPPTTTALACSACKRSVCLQICGPNRPAFCDLDPTTGCPVCACGG